jgi:replication factor C subunit 3/5
VDEIATILVQTAKKEGISCPPDLAMRIGQQSERNLRRALLMLEATKMQCPPNQQSNLSPDLQVPLPDWELFICRLAREIMSDQTPTKLLQAREMLYELLTNCIPADVILITLTRELMKSLDDVLKHEVAYWAAYYEHRIVQGSKDIFHLEAFVAKFMAIYKKWIISLFG